MLKYELNANTLGDDNHKLNLDSVSCHDYYESQDLVEVRNYYNDDINVFVGEKVVAISTIDKEDDYGGTYPITDVDNVTIVQCDNVDKTFSFIFRKYQELSLTGINLIIEDTVLYIHFLFNTWHFFRSWENYGIKIMIDYPSSTDFKKTIVFNGCEVVGETELRWRYNASLDGISDFMCTVFNNDKYAFAGYGEYGEEVDEKYVDIEELHFEDIPETACFTDTLYLKKKIIYTDVKDCWRWELYEKQCNEGSLSGVSAYRVSYKFKDVNYTEEYVTNPLTSITVPISIKSGYDLYQEQNINDKFVNVSVESAKNGVLEMERFAYHPVFRVYDKYLEKYVYKTIHRIKFNLHFREREMNGWIVKQDGYWNGMGGNGLYDNVFGNGIKYFSYGDNQIDGIVDKGRQSDLLTYLGFDDSDVKYQKSRLKKSFVRLSFFDSANRSSQNLLCYSTIYLDSGKLFAKMMRGANKTVLTGNTYRGLYVISGQQANARYVDTKVDREPCLDNRYSIEEVEKYRLSSQLVVSDRYSSACSEGFYLYLWADNDNGTVPSDIYMRVEFNHAGYGRVIPFTMPYDINGIYTFQKVSDCWLNGVHGADGETHYGWGTNKNELYSYIHFKYVYDKENKRHVYYLDDETYKLASYEDSTPDELEINLYEAKINFE